MTTYKRTMVTLAATGLLVMTGAGVASASESSNAGAAAQPNCLETTISGATADPGATLSGTLMDPGAAVSGTLTCLMSFL